MMALFAAIQAIVLISRLADVVLYQGSWTRVLWAGTWLVLLAAISAHLLRGYGFPVAAWWWGTRASESEVWRNRVRAALLAEGRCPSCGYPLHGLEQQPDGCTLCPECGAAWRISV
jgi:hypothetical protein